MVGDLSVLCGRSIGVDDSGVSCMELCRDGLSPVDSAGQKGVRSSQEAPAAFVGDEIEGLEEGQEMDLLDVAGLPVRQIAMKRREEKDVLALNARSVGMRVHPPETEAVDKGGE